MHGQKKRRKRNMQGIVRIGGDDYAWSLLSEPQWTTEGALGLRLSVRLADADRRELVVEFPFDRTVLVPQRPTLTSPTIVAAVQAALDEGWDPQSKGRAHHFRSATPLETGKKSAGLLRWLG